MNDEKIGINFVNIPIEIFSSKELTATEKILYGYLSIFKKQCCFKSNEALAEAIGVSVPTITNSIKHLLELDYIYVEFVNNNNASRRIYTIFDNPKKIKYLIGKGYLKSFPQSFPQSNKNYEPSNKNYEKSNKNYESNEKNNRGESNKFYEHKIKYNKNIENIGSALYLPTNVSRKEMSQEEFDNSFYDRNTIKI